MRLPGPPGEPGRYVDQEFDPDGKPVLVADMFRRSADGQGRLEAWPAKWRRRFCANDLPDWRIHSDDNLTGTDLALAWAKSTKSKEQAENSGQSGRKSVWNGKTAGNNQPGKAVDQSSKILRSCVSWFLLVSACRTLNCWPATRRLKGTTWCTGSPCRKAISVSGGRCDDAPKWFFHAYGGLTGNAEAIHLFGPLSRHPLMSLLEKFENDSLTGLLSRQGLKHFRLCPDLAKP